MWKLRTLLQIVHIHKEVVVETIGPNVCMTNLLKILNISNTFNVPNSSKYQLPQICLVAIEASGKINDL